MAETVSETDRRIIRHRTHCDLPGKWRARRLRYNSFALEVELPCINGLSAWFSIATFHEAEEAERLMTDGARQEASEYAEKFAQAASRRPPSPDVGELEQMRERCAKEAERWSRNMGDDAGTSIAYYIRALPLLAKHAGKG